MKKFLEMDRKILLCIGLFVGIILSVSTVKVLGYTDSSEFCKTCHIMTTVHQSFMDSTHAKLDCNDCHLPHDSIAEKLVFKGKAGIGHMYYNTLGTDKIPSVVHATDQSKIVINENCVNCHESTLSKVKHDAKSDCASCHRSVPHGTDFKTKDFNMPPKPGELLKNKGGFY